MPAPAVFFFFFQAEDGIRDVAVTGVQTCALPIYAADFATQGKVMAPLQPAQRVVRDAARVATPLGKDGRAAEVESASLNVNLREPNRSVDSAVDAKIGGIQIGRAHV